MEWTYEKIAQWFQEYFDAVCKFQGSIDTVPMLKKYFSPDLELCMYTSPSSPPAVSMSRDELLISFIHPGLQEDIVPRHFAIDVRTMTVAVQFVIQFKDAPTNTEWPPLEASAHYHLAVDADQTLKIVKIYYWTERLPEDLFEIWGKRREEVLKDCALQFIHSKA